MRRGAYIFFSLAAHVLLLFWIVHFSFSIQLTPEKSSTFLSRPYSYEEITLLPPGSFRTISPAQPAMTSVKQSASFRKGNPGRPILFPARSAAPLAPKPSGKSDLILPMLAPEAEKPRNLKKYLDPAYPGWSQWPLIKKGETSGITAEKSGPVQLENEFVTPDLRPWASQVVKIISQNWVIPQEAAIHPRSLVVIRILIGKDGEIQKTVLQGSSSTPMLDQAALASLALTRRLPPLPQEYTQERIETTLVFHYGW